MNCSYYYCECGTVFSSKIEALVYSKKNNKKLFYHYYDDVWSKYDWTIEPSKSLEYYYKEQAQIIRDTHDYVILCYSTSQFVWYHTIIFNRRKYLNLHIHTIRK